MDQAIEAVGDEAAKIIINEIKEKGTAEKKNIVVPVTLKERESCGEMLK